MCLGVPAKVVSLTENELGMLMGEVDFGGLRREVCLAFTPDVQVGDYVIVHAGYAISRLNEQEAQEALQAIAELAELSSAEGEFLFFSTGE
jgi:hydrogenase expression/formation protein HypC